MEGTQETMSQVMLHLRKTQEILKSSQRAAAIEQEIAKFKSPNTKRNVKFTRDLLFGRGREGLCN